ncbi:hypothetical protein C8Q79DRAFT_353590 [Trametes meyenii]|nr:hypothetical protein C8Q79DRAFT_353590 [Trametes meyenii]
MAPWSRVEGRGRRQLVSRAMSICVRACVRIGIAAQCTPGAHLSELYAVCWVGSCQMPEPTNPRATFERARLRSEERGLATEPPRPTARRQEFSTTAVAHGRTDARTHGRTDTSTSSGASARCPRINRRVCDSERTSSNAQTSIL